MRHCYINDENGDHYSIGTNGHRDILIQLGEDRKPNHSEQIRLRLTLEQAIDFRKFLDDNIRLAQGQEDLESFLQRVAEEQ